MALAMHPIASTKPRIASFVPRQWVARQCCGSSAATRRSPVEFEDAGPPPSRLSQLLLERRDVLAASVALALVASTAGRVKAEEISKVLVVGATGNTGRRVVRQLRSEGYRVRAGVRDIKKAQALGLALDPQVELIKADVTAGVSPLVEAIGDAQAVICATGNTSFNPKGFTDVDETGTKNLVDAAVKAHVSRFVLMSSLLTNARAVGQTNNPNFKFLNLFGGVLDHKLEAEKYLRASGLDWTIVRPGGLSNDEPQLVGNLVAQPEDTLFGLDTDPGREISRDTVAAVLVAALKESSAKNKLVEVVASLNAPELPTSQWFP